jgi:antitoxin (DNA-binding transcriptional repressor) of toxin-antitoxin stability system
VPLLLRRFGVRGWREAHGDGIRAFKVVVVEILGRAFSVTVRDGASDRQRLTIFVCHYNVTHMKITTIRQLKHDTTTVLDWVAAGETVEVRRRNHPVAILSPPRRSSRIAKPDFAARLRSVYGAAVLPTTGTDIISEARGDR